MNNNDDITSLFLLDIETVPQHEYYNLMPDEWQKLWCEKISKTMPENADPKDTYEQRAGILAEFGKVICISTAFFHINEAQEICLRMKTIAGDDEKLLLEQFIDITDKLCSFNRHFEFCGHNIREFDIPYLCRRMLINKIKLPVYLCFHGAKPWEVRMVDTMQWWKFGDYKNFISLNLLANVLDVPTSKTDIDGSQVQHVYYKEKNLQRIAEYCQRDVVAVANIVLRFKNLPLLTEQNITIVQ